MDSNYGAIYSSDYYKNYGNCGDAHVDYGERSFWAGYFKAKAEKIVDIFSPKTFLDVGCAFGYLVEALRDLGVEAYGVDVSEHAISMVREDIRPYCFVANVAEGLPKELPEKFDCISAIEVIEHLYEEDAQPFIQAVCAHTDCVIFSSSPDDFEERTHLNVQQQEYWAKRFAQEGYLHDLDKDLSFVSPHALAFVKMEKSKLELVEDYERSARLEKHFRKKELESAIDSLERIRTEEGVQARRALDASKEEFQLEKDALTDALKGAQEHARQLQGAHDALVGSTFWKLTWPARRAVSGVKKLLGRQPVQAPQPVPAPSVSHMEMQAQDKVATPAATYWKTLYRTAQPIPTVFTEGGERRLNLVVDGIDPVNLQGGVATSLILATLFVARHKNVGLRIITRSSPVNPLDYIHILELNGIEVPERVEYFSDYDRDLMGGKVTKLPVSNEDIFMATSWWSAKAIEETSLRKHFYYLIQEVETYFYPCGYEQLLCNQVMQNPNISFIVNSHYLWDYFAQTQPNITAHGVYFNPAFSEKMYCKKDFTPKATNEKHTLFFYARPDNPRNLFAYGVLMLDMAISRGILDTSEWEICCAGQDIPDIIFCDGTKPRQMGLMAWADYCKFVADTDLALSLMYTPHPSYPPYDVAVSGGVAVTNSFLNKMSFAQSQNVIMADLETETFLDAIDNGIKLAKDMKKREENYQKTTIPTNWEATLQATLAKMEEWL